MSFLIFIDFLSEVICIIPYCMRQKSKTTIGYVHCLLPDVTGHENEENEHKSSYSESEEYINEIKTTMTDKPLSNKVTFLNYLLSTLFNAFQNY